MRRSRARWRLQGCANNIHRGPYSKKSLNPKILEPYTLNPVGQLCGSEKSPVTRLVVLVFDCMICDLTY